ncbi:cytochrome P450 [Pyronema omphalodes]|nr:cytochrome P450 [Pyronema omphalodes]
MFATLTTRLLSESGAFIANHWPLVIVGVLIGNIFRLILRYWTSPLRAERIPGPFLAGFTNFYRLFYVDITRDWHDQLVKLHKKYGPVVWVAPYEVSVSDPKLRSVIYGFADERKEESFFPKSRSSETGLFNEDFNFAFETDPARARLGKYALSHAYSEKGLMNLEHYFDEAVDEFTMGFKKHVASSDKPHCFSDWAHFFMFDLGTLLMGGYSRGLLRAGKDEHYAIWAARLVFDVVGSLIPVPLSTYVTTRSIRKFLLNKQIEQLYRWALCYDKDKGEAHKIERINEIADSNPNNFMSKFRDAEKKMRRLFPKGNWSESITNNAFFIYAGAMVASSSLPLVIRYIYSNPRVLAKIREELSTLDREVRISDIVHKNGQSSLPYLEASILEGLRLSPSFGLPLGRTVPSLGCRLNEYFIPPTYTVFMSSWCINFDESYFGPDASEFKPERWLGNHPTEIAKDGSGLPRTMRNYLEAGWFTFGAGSRVCIGRHYTEIAFAKFVANFVRTFDLEITEPGYIWYGLIQHTEKMMVKAKVRDDAPDFVRKTEAVVV